MSSSQNSSSYSYVKKVTSFGPDGRVVTTVTHNLADNSGIPSIPTEESRFVKTRQADPRAAANVFPTSLDTKSKAPPTNTTPSLKDIYEAPYHVSKSLEDSINWFNTIKSELVKKRTLFEDPVFPAADRSLFFKERPRMRIEWKRPTEFSRSPQFIADGISRFDVRQGDLGDCWLLAAVASISLYKELFNCIIPENQSFSTDYAGMFLFRFWQYGEWVDVVVDDRLPTNSGQLVYMQSSDSREFWSALLEKAYAKLNGSYESLKGGTTAEAMEDFTGGITETFDLQGKQPKNLFDIIQRSHLRMSLMGCSLDASDGDIEGQGPFGLIKGHAYSITAVATINTRGINVNLIRIRNPWGNDKEWKGPWSDKSREWNDVTSAEREKIGLTFKDDGEFWMSYDDFVRYYTTLEICHLSPESDCPDLAEKRNKRRWELVRYDGEWKRNISAGGCRNNISTFHMNPQFHISVVDPDSSDGDKTGTLIVGLMQKGMRSKRREGEDLFPIGYVIYKMPDNFRGTNLLDANFFKFNNSIAKSAAFVNAREVCERHRLLPGEYVVIPSTFQPNQNAPFLLRLFSEKENAGKELDEKSKILKVDPTPDLPVATMSNDEDARLRKAFISVSGSDMEVDSYELLDILNNTFKREFTFDGFTIDTSRNLMAYVDKDKSSRLNYGEFKELWLKMRIWKTLFKNYDADKSGALNASELREVLRAGGFSVSNKVFNSLVSRYASKLGLIKFNDYMSLFVRMTFIFEFFKSQTKTPEGTALIEKDSFLEELLYI